MNQTSQHDPEDRRREQLHERALNYMEADNKEGFKICLTELLKKNPNEPWVDHLLGFMSSELGQQEEAIPMLRRAVKGLPNKADPKVTLGVALMRLGDASQDENLRAEAEKLHEDALAMDPNSVQALTNLACALTARANCPCLERAEELLRRADKLCPNNVYVLVNLGHALALQGKHQEADAALLRATNLDKSGVISRRIAKFYPQLDPAWPHWPSHIEAGANN